MRLRTQLLLVLLFDLLRWKTISCALMKGRTLTDRHIGIDRILVFLAKQVRVVPSEILLHDLVSLDAS